MRWCSNFSLLLRAVFHCIARIILHHPLAGVQTLVCCLRIVSLCIARIQLLPTRWCSNFSLLLRAVFHCIARIQLPTQARVTSYSPIYALRYRWHKLCDERRHEGFESYSPRYPSPLSPSFPRRRS